ncbi:hypothetical protein LUZ60_001943 [Juncus effusus]|nr:hypothetical protein LUZ60_001943 [Juncus effusus]
MGVMSRKVVPVCGKLCFFCPSLRSRSRQPVKRYKKLLANIFPKSQDAEPNERMIGKLCDYVSRNPSRIPDITTYLEQKCFKELRSGHIYLVKVIPCIYRRLVSSCKEQMPLMAPSSLILARTLLDQTQQNELRVLGCLLLVDFLKNQVDGAYMFNLEGIIPKLCELGQDRDLQIRSSALQVLASLVQYMGDHSHVSMDFDNVVSVTMDNYKTDQTPCENGTQESGVSQSINNLQNELINSMLDASLKNPSYWSRVCLQNMAKLAKEATTVRRVLDPLFRYFDRSDSWSPESGIAFPVLSDMQSSMDSSGENSLLLLSMTIKHLDNKNVTKQHAVLINILKVVTKLAKQEKVQASVSLIAAIGDLMRHLRKCLQFAMDTSDADVAADVSMQNSRLHSALEECLLQLIEKVGDVGPIIDILAVILENISLSANIARSTISSVYRTARILASLPNLSYNLKEFPEALFHELLQTMAHPDHETRVGSHRILHAILPPQFNSPWSDLDPSIPLKEYNPKMTLLTALSSFSPSWSLREKMKENGVVCEGSEIMVHINGDYEKEDKNEDVKSMRLSSQQVGLLLSSIWNQAPLQENKPANYEAMAHTFNLILHFSRAKNSSHMALVRCFQLAFSLRSLSLNNDIPLQASRKRSLYTISTAMLIFSAKACDFQKIVSLVKSTMQDQTVDSHLSLKEDSETIFLEASRSAVVYGSDEDEATATEFLSNFNKDDLHLKETLISYLAQKFQNLPEELLKEQIFQEFCPDDSFLFGAPHFMETPHPCSPYTHKGSRFSEEESDHCELEDEDTLFELSTSQSDLGRSGSTHSNEVLSVNKLIESVMATAQQVTNSSSSANLVSFDQMKNNCEALLMEKQQKMSALLSFKFEQDSCDLVLEERPTMNGNKESHNHDSESQENYINKENNNIIRCDSLSSGSENSFRLPPASPYDKFLKAAGW